MQLSDAGQQLATRPSPNATVAPGWFNNAPATSPPTIVDADALNAVMAELLQFLNLTGQTASKTNAAQVATAALMLFGLYGLDSGAVVNEYIITPVLPLPALADGQRVLLSTQRPNTGAATLQLSPLAAQPILFANGNPVGAGTIFQGLNEVFWQAGLGAFVVSRPGRLVLNGDVTYYVNASTGSDANNGLTSGTAWATLTHAWQFIQANIDFSGYVVTVECAGDFSTGLIAEGSLVGATQDGSSLTFNFAAGASIDVTNANAVWVLNGAALTIAGTLSLAATGSDVSGTGNGLYSEYNSSILVTGQMSFGACGGCHIFTTLSSSIAITADYDITGSSPNHINCSNNSFVSIIDLAIALTGSPAFSSAFALAQNCGIIASQGCAFSGAPTGSRYLVTGNAVINTQLSGPDYFPGSIAGTTSAGGQYI